MLLVNVATFLLFGVAIFNFEGLFRDLHLLFTLEDEMDYTTVV